MAVNKSKPAPELPITGSIPEAGRLFFGVNREAAYRLARQGVIPVIETGSRNKRALLHVLRQRLTQDPQNDGGATA